MASTKINFDTKELQIDLSMELSGVISARRWRRIYCRESRQWWRLVADMWRCLSVDDQRIHAMQCVHIWICRDPNSEFLTKSCIISFSYGNILTHDVGGWRKILNSIFPCNYNLSSLFSPHSSFSHDACTWYINLCHLRAALLHWVWKISYYSLLSSH